MARAGMNPATEAALVWRLIGLFRREQPDLVHGFIIKGALYGALAARLARRGTLVMIPGSGVDCERFRPMARAEATGASGPAGPPRLRVLLASRLLWHKGLAEYVEAARMLRAEGGAVDFLLAGAPDPDNPTSVPESTVRTWVRRGWVRWLGYVEDMPGLLHAVDAVVLPSYREGLPKALVEGAACGLPLIATDAPGCREVVTDGVEGLLVPARDAPALAAAVRRLRDDPALRRRMGAAARAKAVAEFEVGKVVRRTLDGYAELLPGFR